MQLNKNLFRRFATLLNGTILSFVLSLIPLYSDAADQQTSHAVAEISLAAQSQLNDALQAFDTGNFIVALKQLEKLSSQYPDQADIQFYFARSLFRDQQLDRSKTVLERNLKQHPNHVESNYVLGSVELTRVAEVSWFSKAGLAKSALNYWKKAVALDPSHAEALYGVTSFLLSAPSLVGGNEKEGYLSLEELRKLSPGYAALVDASLASKAEDFDNAEQLFKQAIAGIPGRAFPTLMLANLYLNHKDYQSALATINLYRTRHHTWNDPGNAQTALMEGKAWIGEKKNREGQAGFATRACIKAFKNRKETG